MLTLKPLFDNSFAKEQVTLSVPPELFKVRVKKAICIKYYLFVEKSTSFVFRNEYCGNINAIKQVIILLT